jgi:hypothetical protein
MTVGQADIGMVPASYSIVRILTRRWLPSLAVATASTPWPGRKQPSSLALRVGCMTFPLVT